MRDNMEWRSIEGATGYEVSESGDVRKAGSLVRLRGYINADGYIEYHIDGRHRTAQRLVAAAFLDPALPGQFQVAHRDGSRLNCHRSNLYWATSLQNHDDRRRHGTGPVGERNPKAKITEADVLEIRREYREIKRRGSGRTVSELDRRYGLDRSTIISIARGKSWTHVPDDAALGMA